MEFSTKEETLYERYKQEKLRISAGFINIVLKFFIMMLSCYLLLSPMIFNFTSRNYATLAIMLAISIAIHGLNRNSNLGYYLGVLFTTLLCIRTMYVAFWKFPEFTILCAPLSFFYLWHCHLEFVYNRVQGYITIALHTFMWCYFAVDTGYIRLPVPHDVVFALSVLVIFQFIWYRYHMSKDYDELKNKIELEISDSNIKNLINAIPEGVAVLSENLSILMSNSASLKLLQGQTIFQLKINERFNNHQRNTCQDLMKYVNEFKESQEITTTFGVCSVQNFYLECTGSKTKWNNQLAIVLTFREVSNIIKLESEVSLNSKTLRILQGISHELKTPLNKIINDNQELLRGSEQLSDTVNKHVQKSYSSAKYLLSLIKDMIDYSHIKFNNLFLTFGWVLVEEMLTECIQMFKDMNNGYEISCTKETMEIMHIYTDKNRLKQCFINLLSFSLG